MWKSFQLFHFLFTGILIDNLAMMYGMDPLSDVDMFYLKGGGDSYECPVGFFNCNASVQCVAQRLNCDGIADCDNGSDEWNCVDDVDSRFWDHLFRKQPFGRSDDIHVGDCAWNHLNTTCLCRGNEILCRFNEMRIIPTGLPNDGIAMLDLTGNIFPIIRRDFFLNIPQVKILVLKFCSIEIIEPFAFEPFADIYLETLYLDENRIQSLPRNLFPIKNWIRVLILSGNIINVLHDYDFLYLDHLKELDLRNNRITTFQEDVFKPLKSLAVLYLNGNRIQIIESGMLPLLDNLRTLSLAQNHIRSITKGSFNLSNLEYLFLSKNHLTTIRNRTFCNIPRLLGLNLDGNEISAFELEAFKCVENLTSLLLTDNKFRTLDNRVLGRLRNLNYIYFSWFHLCKAALHVRVCEPKGDGISSKQHLLDNTVLRISVWIMTTTGICGNLVVLFGRYDASSRSHIEHSLYLRHLAASDLLMGLYLAAIASADIKFRGEYIIHEESWRESLACATCGFLSTLSCQSSTLLLTLVTWDRLVSVTRPLQPRTSSKTIVVFRLFVLWAASFIPAGAPLTSISYFGRNFYGNNGVCLSLHIHDPYAKGWEYSAGLFIFINTFSLIFIIVSYLRMLQAIRGSGEAMRSTLSGRENIVARRFAIIVATDCICWLPIIVVKLGALGGIKISPSLYAWLAVLVLPINSALNPVLYTLTTASFKQQIMKCFNKLPCGVGIEPRSQTACDSALSLSLGHFPTNSGRKRLITKQLSYV